MRQLRHWAPEAAGWRQVGCKRRSVAPDAPTSCGGRALTKSLSTWSGPRCLGGWVNGSWRAFAGGIKAVVGAAISYRGASSGPASSGSSHTATRRSQPARALLFGTAGRPSAAQRRRIAACALRHFPGSGAPVELDRTRAVGGASAAGPSEGILIRMQFRDQPRGAEGGT